MVQRSVQKDEPRDISEADETARLILEAASKRFLHYGYGKTTMSEIAKDCNMSTGNLYRFFASKLAIAEGFVSQIRSDQISQLRTIVNDASVGAAERLRQFLTLKFRLAYDRFHDRPKAYELSAEILTERPAFAEEWAGAEAELIVEILNQGEKEGLFNIPDKPQTARVIQDTVFRFTSPAIFHAGDSDVLSRELNEIVDLVLDAFAYRMGHTQPQHE